MASSSIMLLLQFIAASAAFGSLRLPLTLLAAKYNEREKKTGSYRQPLQFAASKLLASSLSLQAARWAKVTNKIKKKLN